MEFMNTKQRDALNNAGLPQFVNYSTIYELSKKDIESIKRTIQEFDSYYLLGWKESTTRNELINIINTYCETFRCYNLIIK